VGARLREYGDAVDHDPAGLERAESRAAAVAALKKKYGPALEDVFATKERIDEELSSLETGEEDIAQLRAAEDEAADVLRTAGASLARVRSAGVERFTRELEAVAAQLAMEDSGFEVELDEIPFDSWTDDGPHRVEIVFLPSPGEKARPLAKVASGGEISRVMLALKAVFGRADATPVLVFDEIDAGVGGSTAVAVGQTLAELARSHQVIVVTHLAQVAAFADRHLVVSKEEREGRSVTVVRPAEGEERLTELARMLSGSGSETGIAHARELLDVAAGS
jgi:DNA repair protein RecN (Recombination protein N)